jgi:hypothetical protein
MLSTPSPDALMALEQASRLPRWTDIEKMIDAELQAILDRILGSKDTADLHELRGRAKALREFQQTVRDARQTLAKQGLAAPIT